MDGGALPSHLRGPLRRPWLGVARAVWRAALSERISLVAAGCAFYAVLALFPALSLVVSTYGLFFDIRTVEPQLEVLAIWLPDAAFRLIAERVHVLVTTPSRTLGLSAAASLLVALWSAGAGVRALTGALNLANGTEECRGILAFQALTLAMTLGTILLVVTGIVLLAAWPSIVRAVDLGTNAAWALRMGSLAILVVLVVLGLAAIYRFGPCRPPRFPRIVWPGAVTATLLWGAALLGFSYYVANIASYDAMYGSLGTVVALLMWLYVSVFAIMLGAELNAVLGRRARRRTG